MKNIFKAAIGGYEGRRRRLSCRPVPAMLWRCLFAVCLTLFLHATGWTCGYHDPASIRVGLLNWFYPEALHVNGAIWRAQQAGRLPRPDTERLLATGDYRKELDAAAFEKTKQALHRLGARMSREAAMDRTEQFSMVLVENGLWSWFSISRMHQTVAVDVNGPGISELVVVTDDPVVHAIAGGDLSLSEAVEAGFMKLYGDPERIDQFVTTYAGVGGRNPP